MPHQRDTPRPTRRQFQLAHWFAGVVEAFEERGWTKARIAREAGLNRKDLYRWMDPTSVPKSPRSETIRRICNGLNLDYSVPARIMGWEPSNEERLVRPPESALDRQIRLIKIRLDQNPPDEERRRLERLYVRAKRQREEQRLMDEEIAEILGGSDGVRDEHP